MLLGLDREQTYKPDYAESHSVLVDLLKHFSQCMSKDINLIELQSSSSLSKLISNVPAFREHYSDSKTSQFCLQYLHSIEVFLLFLKAERSRNWEMHFQTVREMMSYFDSLWHHLNAKPTYLYYNEWKSFLKLIQIFTESFKRFYSIRSDKCWAGLSTDFVIEQEAKCENLWWTYS